MVASVDCLVVYEQTNKLTKRPITYPVDKIRYGSNPRHLWQIEFFRRYFLMDLE